MDVVAWSTLTASAGVAVTHTLLGPDHYLPFAMLSRAHRWPLSRTLGVTVLFGAGHVAASLALAASGLLAGAAVGSFEPLDRVRGGLAAWALVAVGLAYGIWGVRRALRRAHGLEPHAHGARLHVHAGGGGPHEHAAGAGGASAAGFWVLFAIVVLGPCEPLIPLFVLPASRGRWGLAAASALLFGLVTIVSMVAAVALAVAGLGRASSALPERWAHALAGAVIAGSGGVVIVLGV